MKTIKLINEYLSSCLQDDKKKMKMTYKKILKKSLKGKNTQVAD
jgi:hypothetical protein